MSNYLNSFSGEDEINTDEIVIESITVIRAEGDSNLCNIPVTVKTIKEANFVLFTWSFTVTHKGYDKCDFIVKFSNGAQGKGRFDLKQYHQLNGVELQKHFPTMSKVS